VAIQEPGHGPEPASPGLLASLRSLVATAVDVLRTRLALLATEVEEESLRLARLAFLGLIALLLLALGLLTFTLLIVILFWDSHRIMAAGLLTVLYLGGAVGIGLYVRSGLRGGSKMFSASLAELDKDREKLASRHVP
jgi:uncharacterized membrane protein YqjE